MNNQILVITKEATYDIYNNDFKNSNKIYDTIIFGRRFNKSILNIEFPNSIKTILFGSFFNQPIDNVKFPENLEKLCFGDNFNQEVNNLILPKNLKILKFGYHFNKSLDNLVLPEKLEILELGLDYDLKLTNLKIGYLTKIILYNDSKNTLNNLPVDLKFLEVNYLSEPLKNLPFMLEILYYKNSDEDYINKSKIPFGCHILKKN